MDKYHQIIKSVSLQTGIHPKVGTVIMDNFFRYISDVLSETDLEDEDSFKNIRIPKLGIIYSTKDKRKREVKRQQIRRKK